MPSRRPAAPLPTRFAPQLATLVRTPPGGDEWLHEIKFDGYRIAARVDSGRVVLLSRRNHDWTRHFPEVRDAVARLPARQALLDGEVAAVLPDGRTSFQALQRRGDRPPPLTYFLFDLLHLDGDDVARLALEERKRRLASLVEPLAATTPLRVSSHARGDGPRVLAAACARGLEGIVSKRRDLPYRPGRHGGWLKSKCLQRQELVIGGFTEPEGSRSGLGALLVGVHDASGALRFAGKVGTGFSHQGALELRARLERLVRATAPFVDPPREWRRWRVHWVRPELVAEVTFAEWTEDGRLRAPSFQGLRADKPASEVVREEPVTLDARPATAPARERKTSGAGRRPPRTPPPSSKVPVRGKGAGVVAGIRLSHPERVLYPDDGITKLDLARFYEAIGDWIVPHVAGRPLTLVRCPKGLGSCFYMKHTKTSVPDALRRVAIREAKKVGDYVVADTVAAVVALAQMDVLEIHTWSARVHDLERPDRIVLDLDPGPGVAWKEVVATARLVRAAFEALGLVSFLKTTGGKGLHVVAPLVPHHDWSTCLAFARGLAETIVREDPRRFTTAFAKRGRERKILLDYLRNNRGSTAVAAFSTRAAPGAPVSTPIDWDELSPRLRSDHFHVDAVRTRLRRLRRDPWRDYWTARQRLGARALAAVGAAP